MLVGTAKHQGTLVTQPTITGICMQDKILDELQSGALSPLSVASLLLLRAVLATTGRETSTWLPACCRAECST